MLKPIYSIRDSKTEFSAPVLDISDAAAIRSFNLTVRQINEQLHYPVSDFSLWRVGFFDTTSGVLSCPASGVPEFVSDATPLSDSVTTRGGVSDEKSESVHT